MNSTELDAQLSKKHSHETSSGERFPFGENWLAFLATVDETRVGQAVDSLKKMLGIDNLEGMRFVDVGSGSGLFSLAASRLGAEVVSFDYDPSSVGCTLEMQKRFKGGDKPWRIIHGSALDKPFLESLGSFDFVYSWGVLHHTGSMWVAIDNVVTMVKPNGVLFISIYNDQGVWSKRWKFIKKVYCSGIIGKLAVSTVVIPYWISRAVISDVVRFRAPWHTLIHYGRERGMSIWHDWHDWLGGYPFEVAKPEGVILPIQKQGFALLNLNTQYGTVGCVEYVFKRTS